MLKIRDLIVTFSLFAAIPLAQAAERVEVFKSPYCGCCEKWVEHMRSAGFVVVTKNVNDVASVRKSTGMPEQFSSCHTAKVGGYVLEGHIPAADVKRMLKEKPNAIGLAVPGMPQGSPGMETNHPQPFDTLLIQAGGRVKVFAKH